MLPLFATWWKELGIVVLIALFPVLPVALFGWSALQRRRVRGRDELHEVDTGRAPETPFAAIGAVALFVGGVAVLFAALVIGVRALVL